MRITHLPWTSLLLVGGFSLQMLAFYLARQPSALAEQYYQVFAMIPGVILFTLGSMLFAHRKGRFWLWGCLAVIMPFFLVLLLIPSRQR